MHKHRDKLSHTCTHTTHIKEHTLSIVSTVFYLLFLSVRLLCSSRLFWNNLLSFFQFLSSPPPCVPPTFLRLSSNPVWSPSIFSISPPFLHPETPASCPVISLSVSQPCLIDNSSFSLLQSLCISFPKFPWIPPSHTHPYKHTRTYPHTHIPTVMAVLG